MVSLRLAQAQILVQRLANPILLDISPLIFATFARVIGLKTKWAFFGKLRGQASLLKNGGAGFAYT